MSQQLVGKVSGTETRLRGASASENFNKETDRSIVYCKNGVVSDRTSRQSRLAGHSNLVDKSGCNNVDSPLRSAASATESKTRPESRK